MAEQMKPSGIDWIGDIPESWKVKPLKYLAKCNQDVLLETTAPDYSFRYVDIGSVTYERGITEYQELRFEDSPSRARRRVSVGDTIISTVRTYLKAIAIISDSENVIVSTGFAVYTPDKAIYPQYLYYFCKSEGFVQEIDKNSYGIAYPAINTDLLSRICIAYPCYEEQQVIADFLDKECAQIDSIAADLEKQIALLQQYKKSLITEIVTKGLDKSVPMKDSGVEWLGKIPAHWNFKRLKFMLENSSDSMKVGPFGSALSGSDFTDEGKWVYNQRVVLDNNFSENTTFVSEEKFQEMRSFAVYPGDILITTRGTIGKVAIVPEGANEGILHPCIIKFRVDKEMIIPELLQLIFNESDFVKDQFTLMSNATTIEVIYSYSLKDILLPVIPADEQEKIYGYLSKKCITIDGIISEKQKALATIIQHKKSLIYEYVTGKKRVKEVR